MIGAIWQQQLNQILSEFNSSWIDLKTSFDYIYEAAKDFAKETSCCHLSQTITTISGTSDYNLNPDFMEVLTKDDHNKPIVKFYDGNSTDWLSMQSYSDFLQDDDTPDTPNCFSITDAPTISRISGTTTSAGVHSGGESVLRDTTADFSTVYPGDVVINATNDYYGYCIAKGTTSITTAMFDLTVRGGQYVSWGSGDAYIIQPVGRYQIWLDPTPSISGQIITVPYFAKPIPVYSDYGIYPFATGYEEALIKYAAWLYKYRDSKPQFGDPLYVAYERTMRKGKNVNRKAVGKKGFRVNFMKGG
jgi:hypothetical protein